MRHAKEGTLRAYVDRALPPAEQAWVEAHLQTCAHCRQRHAEFQVRGEQVRGWMARLAPEPPHSVPAPQVARRRLDALIAHKENAMRNRTFARRYRPAWIAAALILVFAVGFALPPVRAAERDLLALFRVQKIQFVEIDPANMPDEDKLEAALSRLEAVMEDQITIEGGGETVELDPATAREQAGFPLRLPAVLEETPQLWLEPYTYAEMQVDLPRVRALLNELGYDGQTLPDSLDGAHVSIGVGPLVLASYGTCRGPEAGRACTVLIQMPAPEVDAPPELDLNQLGQAYLQLLGMSPVAAAEFSSRVDWTTTLVLPLPASPSLTYREVTVDGAPGTLLRPPSSSQHRNAYLLTWVGDGVVYALSGQGSLERALEIANSVQ